MQAVWDRLEHLAAVTYGQAAAQDPYTVATLALLPDPSLPSLAGEVPSRFTAADAVWLTAEAQTRLLLRSQRAPAGAEHLLAVDEGSEIRAVTLRIGDLHLGVLAALVLRGCAPPWTRTTVQRLTETLAAAVAPRLATKLAASRAERSADGLLQLELERLGVSSGRVAIVRFDPTGGPCSHVRGEVATSGGAASFLARVRGGPSPSGLATVLATSVRRWLTDLPDPDPSTVIDAVCVDLAPLLERFHAAADLAVIVPGGRRSLQVSTTLLPVVGFDADGRSRAAVRATGTGLMGLDLGHRVSGELVLPPGGYALAVDEVTDERRLARYGVPRLGSGQDAISALAAEIGDAIVAEDPEVNGMVVHAAQ